VLYTIANTDWSPGHPLTPGPARPGLFRWRSQAEAASTGRPLLAVALRYDPIRGSVVPAGPVARMAAGPWAAPAIVVAGGEVKVLAEIPGALVRKIGQAELKAHPAKLNAVSRSHLAVPKSNGPRATDRPPPLLRIRFPAGGQSAA